MTYRDDHAATRFRLDSLGRTVERLRAQLATLEAQNRELADENARLRARDVWPEHLAIPRPEHEKTSDAVHALAFVAGLCIVLLLSAWLVWQLPAH